WPVVGVLVATLGLAPFSPQPHVLEKLAMLFDGTLSRPIDIFDLALHGTPWVLLIIKAVNQLLDKGKEAK
ncbi:MAG: RND transporter, partial [Arenicellales bacterium]